MLHCGLQPGPQSEFASGPGRVGDTQGGRTQRPGLPVLACEPYTGSTDRAVSGVRGPRATVASTPAWKGERKRGVGPRKEAEAAPPALGKEATPPPPPVRASAQNEEISAVHFGFLFHSQRSGWGISSRPNWLSVLSVLPSSGLGVAARWWPIPGRASGPSSGVCDFPCRKPLLLALREETPHTSYQVLPEPGFDSVTQD